MRVRQHVEQLRLGHLVARLPRVLELLVRHAQALHRGARHGVRLDEHLQGAHDRLRLPELPRQLQRVLRLGPALVRAGDRQARARRRNERRSLALPVAAVLIECQGLVRRLHGLFGHGDRAVLVPRLQCAGARQRAPGLCLPDLVAALLCRGQQLARGALRLRGVLLGERHADHQLQVVRGELAAGGAQLRQRGHLVQRLERLLRLVLRGVQLGAGQQRLRVVRLVARSVKALGHLGQHLAGILQPAHRGLRSHQAPGGLCRTPPHAGIPQLQQLRLSLRCHGSRPWPTAGATAVDTAESGPPPALRTT
mmetsp:Transcript_74232/g.191511  ORF Transcript_74232/g.191511 Transcript_74232/m.191511 type:complete len:309 (+) Transcript_74232:847-1773(+)